MQLPEIWLRQEGDVSVLTISASVVEFQEALEEFRRRRAILPEQLDALGNYANNRAFTYAGAANLAIVEQVRESLLEAVRTGRPLQEWQRDIRNTLLRDWGDYRPREGVGARIETIARNAAQRAYNAGRWFQLTDELALQARPFWMLDVVLDSRTSDVCQPLKGVVLPANDPFWSTHVPPLHHRCRSTIRALRQREVDRRGGLRPPPENAPQVQTGWGAPPNMERPWTPQNVPPALQPGLARQIAEAQAEAQRKAEELAAQKAAEEAAAQKAAEEAAAQAAKKAAEEAAAQAAARKAEDELRAAEAEAARNLWVIGTDISNVDEQSVRDRVEALTPGVFVESKDSDAARFVKNADIERKREYWEQRPEQRDALFAYSHGSDQAICGLDRGVPVRNREKFEALRDKIIEAIEQSPRSPTQIFRGEQWPASWVRRLLEADTVEFSSMTSFTRSSAVADSFAAESDTEFAIVFQLKTARAGDMQGASDFPQEQEMLLPPHQRFRIVSIQKNPNTTNGLIVTLEE